MLEARDATTRDRILASARSVAQAQGYGGVSFRDLARDVGIKPASVYHYFPSKADLGVAVARRYWEDTAAALETLSADTADALSALRRYPRLFRRALEDGNRICMCSFMAAEFDDLPSKVRQEVRKFAEVNVAWLTSTLSQAGVVSATDSAPRARAIFAAVAGAQLVARSHSDVSIYDSLIDGYRTAGLLPA